MYYKNWILGGQYGTMDFPSGQSRYCSKKSHWPWKHFFLIDCDSKKCFHLWFFRKKKSIKKKRNSRKSPENSFFPHCDVTTSYMLLCLCSFTLAASRRFCQWLFSRIIVIGQSDDVSYRSMMESGKYLMRKPETFLACVLGEQLYCDVCGALAVTLIKFCAVRTKFETDGVKFRIEQPFFQEGLYFAHWLLTKYFLSPPLSKYNKVFSFDGKWSRDTVCHV